MKIGGEGGDRTHGPVARTAVFETARFGHSRTSPLGRTRLLQGRVAAVVSSLRLAVGGAYPGEYDFSIGFLFARRDCTHYSCETRETCAKSGTGGIGNDEC